MTNLIFTYTDTNGNGDYDEGEPITSYKNDPCGAMELTDRDLGDVHAIYHPDSIGRPKLVNDAGWKITGIMPWDTNGIRGRLEFNAYRLVVLNRPLESNAGDPYSLVKALAMEETELSGKVDISLGADFDATGKELLVAGVTRGDPERQLLYRSGSLVRWVAHSEVTSSELGGASWALSRSWDVGGSGGVGGAASGA